MTHLRAQDAPSESEIIAMAAVLDRRYGVNAGSVAYHFVLEHEAAGDAARARLWAQVRTLIARKRVPSTLS